MEAVIESSVAGARETGLRRNRDLELVRYVGRHGVVRIGQVMIAMEAGRSVTYDRVATCVEAGLLERLELIRSEPGLLRATREGLRYAGLGLPVAVISPGTVDHWLRCASTAHLLGRHFGHERVLTEREILLAEQIEERPIASAAIGKLPNGKRQMHRADLAVLPDGHPLLSWSADATTLTAHPRTRERGREIAGDDGRALAGAEEMRAGVIAVEVELTPKAPRRLQGILRGWRRAVGADVVAEVHYHCAAGQTRKAVERAVVKVEAQKFIGIGAVVAR